MVAWNPCHKLWIKEAVEPKGMLHGLWNSERFEMGDSGIQNGTSKCHAAPVSSRSARACSRVLAEGGEHPAQIPLSVSPST